MKQVFAPGCALLLYKPRLAEKLHKILIQCVGDIELLNICCKHQPSLKKGTEVINICPGCDKRYRENYDDSSTISLWEILAESDFFAFPDYHGKQMTINDACPTRDQSRVQNAIRTLIKKMNITLIEPKKTREKGICCGDSFWGIIPIDQVKQQMIKRSSEMPVEDVVVYCVSCSKSFHIGGKKPHYMIDLLFHEETIPKIYEPDQWHKELNEYIAQH